MRGGKDDGVYGFFQKKLFIRIEKRNSLSFAKRRGLLGRSGGAGDEANALALALHALNEVLAPRTDADDCRADHDRSIGNGTLLAALGREPARSASNGVAQSACAVECARARPGRRWGDERPARSRRAGRRAWPRMREGRRAARDLLPAGRVPDRGRAARGEK